MSRHALFTSAPFVGHLGPLLTQADELVRRGWRVTVACLEEGRALVDSHPGVAYASLGTADLQPSEIDALRSKITFEPNFSRSMLTVVNTLGRGWAAAYQRTLGVLEQDRPNVVVADLSSTAGVSAAETLGVTCIINNPDLLTVLPTGLLPPAPDIPLLLSGKSIHSINRVDRWLYPLTRTASALVANLIVGRPLNTVRRSCGLPSVDFQRWFVGKLILVNSAFGLEYQRQLPPSIQMVGPLLPEDLPTLPPDYDSWLADGPPVVYVNLGTIARPWRELLHRMAEGLTAHDFRVLWVVPKDIQPLLPERLPPAFRVEAWVPSQLGVLGHSNVCAFVTHCGVNSVQEAVWTGTPVVGIPLFAAQGDMALRVQDAGIGARLDKHRFTPDGLRQELRRVSRSGQFRQNVAAIRQTLIAAGGITRAADLIEQATLAGVYDGRRAYTV